MQNEQDGIVAVFAANGDPLLDTANLDVSGFINAVRIGDGVVLRVPFAQEFHHRFQLLNLRIVPLPRRSARLSGR